MILTTSNLSLPPGYEYITEAESGDFAATVTDLTEGSQFVDTVESDILKANLLDPMCSDPLSIWWGDHRGTHLVSITPMDLYTTDIERDPSGYCDYLTEYYASFLGVAVMGLDRGITPDPNKGIFCGEGLLRLAFPDEYAGTLDTFLSDVHSIMSPEFPQQRVYSIYFTNCLNRFTVSCCDEFRDDPADREAITQVVNKHMSRISRISPQNM